MQNTSQVKRALVELRHAEKEHLYIIKPKGRARKFQGSFDQVSMPNSFLFEIENATLIHNHPGGSSFSIQDIRILTKFDSKECFLVTENNIHHLEKQTNDWGINADSIEFKERYKSCYHFAVEYIDKLITKNEIPVYDREAEIIHYIWALFFYDLENIHYVRKNFDDFQNSLH